MYALSIRLSMHFLIMEMDGAKRALDWLSTWNKDDTNFSFSLSNIRQYCLTSWMSRLCLRTFLLFMILTMAA